jgi:hypothetical protein
MTEKRGDESGDSRTGEGSHELIGLLKALVDREISDELSAMVDDFSFDDGTTKLQCFGPNFDMDMDPDVPRETIYVLSGQGFLIQMRYSRNAVSGTAVCSLEHVEGADAAKRWLRSQPADSGSGDLASG